jgi:hypothetical protein
MAAPGPRHRALMCGILFGALACAAPSSAARVAVPSVPAIALGAPLLGHSREGAEALLQLVHPGRFCRWYPAHRLCLRLVASPRLCELNPDHRLCAGAAVDDFCERRPDHPLCDVDRFCERRPDHPLCDDGQPPSPS